MANRFWVGGTGTWDASTTTHWAASSNGAGGASVPGTGDTVTFDGSSGGGTVTVNTTVAVQSITCGAFTGTLDFSVNNNDVTLTAATGFSGTGSGTRTINLGNGTWTLSSTSASNTWNMTTVTNLTFNANSSKINLSGASTGGRTFVGGGLTYNEVTIGAPAAGGATTITGNNTFATLNITAPNFIALPSSGTTTITNPPSWVGTSTQIIDFENANAISGARSTISIASGTPTLIWTAWRSILCSGGATFNATNSFDLGNNSGIAITAPSGGGTQMRINDGARIG